MPRNPGLNPTAQGASTAMVDSPFCRELRSKKYFMLNRLATDASHYLDDSDHCWCCVTQQVVGPDGGKVTPYQCIPGRGCYKSALSDSE